MTRRNPAKVLPRRGRRGIVLWELPIAMIGFVMAVIGFGAANWLLAAATAPLLGAGRMIVAAVQAGILVAFAVLLEWRGMDGSRLAETVCCWLYPGFALAGFAWLVWRWDGPIAQLLDFGRAAVAVGMVLTGVFVCLVKLQDRTSWLGLRVGFALIGFGVLVWMVIGMIR